MQPETPSLQNHLNHDNPPKRSLWRVAILIMAIVFGPALVAWVVTLIH